MSIDPYENTVSSLKAEQPEVFEKLSVPKLTITREDALSLLRALGSYPTQQEMQHIQDELSFEAARLKAEAAESSGTEEASTAAFEDRISLARFVKRKCSFCFCGSSCNCSY